MNEDLQKLLAVVEALDAKNRSAEESPPTDEELNEALAALGEALQEAVGGEKIDLEAGRAIREAINKIEAENVTRTEQREKDKAEAAALLEGIGAKASDEEGEEGEKEGEGEGSEEEKEETEAKSEKVPALVSSLSDAIRRGAQRKVEKVIENLHSADVIVATVGQAQGFQLAQDAGLAEVATIFDRYAGQVKRGSAVLLHMEKMYPESRALGLSAEDNTRLIDSVMSPRAITAAGGICEPLPADFTHPICGDRGRPIRDALPAFRADRGGARFAPSTTVADLEGGITVWTSTTDADPGSETKACPRIDCVEEVSASVDAIVACLTVGNFQARFNPEFWRSRLDLLMVAHDRIAEQTLYATMLADPVVTTTTAPADAGDGTITDLLRVIDMQVAGISDRHRLIGTRFFTVLPRSLRNAIRTQLANQAPSGSDSLFGESDAGMNAWFAARNVTPVWSPDIELIGAQGGGALAAYNTPFNVLTFPEGTFLFLDGGTLDLGTSITDSALNAVNDRQAFMETFEQVVGRGCEALVTPVTVAADCICGT